MEDLGRLRKELDVADDDYLLKLQVTWALHPYAGSPPLRSVKTAHTAAHRTHPLYASYYRRTLRLVNGDLQPQ